MTQQKDIRTRVGYSLDSSSVTAVQAGNSKVAASFIDVKSAAANMGADILRLNPALAEMVAKENAAATAANQQAGAQEKAAAATEKTVGATQRAADAYDRASQSATRASQSAQRASTPQQDLNFSSGFGTLRSLSGAAGALAGNSQAGTLLASFAGLTTELGVFGVAAAGAAVLVRGAAEAEQARAAAAKQFIDAAVGTSQLTASDIQAQIDAQRASIDSATEARDKLKGFQDQLYSLSYETGLTYTGTQEYEDSIRQLNAELYDATGGAFGMKDGVGTLIYNFEELQSGIDAAQPVINATTGEIAFLTVQLGSTVVQANTAAEAEQELAEQRERAATALTAIQQSELDAAIRAQNLTQEQRAERIRQIQLEISSRDAYRESHELTEAALQANSVAVDKLRNELVQLEGVTDSTADQLARAKARTEAIADAFDSLTVAEEKFQAAAQKVRDAQDAITDGRTKHENKLVEIETERQSSEAEARRKAAAQAEEDGRKHKQRLAEIDDQYAMDRESALGKRDALALFEATRNRNAAITKENTAYTEQQRQLQANLDEQLLQYQAAAKKQKDAENVAYTERQAKLVEALQDAQVEQSRADGVRQAYLKMANEAQLREVGRHNDRVEDANKASHSKVESATASHKQRVESAEQSSNTKIEAQRLSHYRIIEGGEAAHWNVIVDIAAAGRMAVRNEVAGMFADILAIARESGLSGGGSGGGFVPGFTTGTFNAMWDRRNLQFQKAVNGMIDSRVLHQMRAGGIVP